MCITRESPSNSFSVCRYGRIAILDQAGLERQAGLLSDTATRKSFAQGANGWKRPRWHSLARPISQPQGAGQNRLCGAALQVARISRGKSSNPAWRSTASISNATFGMPYTTLLTAS